MNKRFLCFLLALSFTLGSVVLGTSLYAFGASTFNPEAYPAYPTTGQTYWIIFNEGYRSSRLEMSTIDVTDIQSNTCIVWNRGLVLNDRSKASRCNQYKFNDDGTWEQIGTYPILSDYATKVIASNLNVYDKDGKLLVPATEYKHPDYVSGGRNATDFYMHPLEKEGVIHYDEWNSNQHKGDFIDKDGKKYKGVGMYSDLSNFSTVRSGTAFVKYSIPAGAKGFTTYISLDSVWCGTKEYGKSTFFILFDDEIAFTESHLETFSAKLIELEIPQSAKTITLKVFQEYPGNSEGNHACFFGVPTFIFDEVAEDIVNSGKTFIYAAGIGGANYESTYYYDDNYLAKSSYEYNHQLATMSLCMAMAAFGRANVDYAKQGVNGEEDYADYNIKKLMEDIELEDIEISLVGTMDDGNTGYPDEPIEDSIGAAIGNKTIKFSDGSECTLVAVAVRGGGYGREWGGNFRIGSGMNHEGFEIAKNAVIKALDAYLEKYNGKMAAKPVKIWFTSYSRGSAVANLCAAHIDKNISSYPTLGSRDNLFTYCFETPAGTTDKDWNNSIYDNIFCWVNPNDFVPKVAMVEWKFHRYGITKFFPIMTSGKTKQDFYAKESAMLDQFEKLQFDSDDYVVKNYKGIDATDYLVRLKNGKLYSIWESDVSKFNLNIANTYPDLLPDGVPIPDDVKVIGGGHLLVFVLAAAVILVRRLDGLRPGDVQLRAAVAAIDQAVEWPHFAPAGVAALALFAQLLDALPRLLVHDGFLRVLGDDPLVLWLVDHALVFVGAVGHFHAHRVAKVSSKLRCCELCSCLSRKSSEYFCRMTQWWRWKR